MGHATLFHVPHEAILIFIVVQCKVGQDRETESLIQLQL